eukprot:CAMPEP_0174723792 /NCGR_PEP_ID=MMETSP1094-20130205/41860_1 /TAXON_ID=156173 /ORGANISM="Chrysochromulina brevifilum, Strain UTEX LB 985" /LENGTH=55 /DNA_ID=CAMNT_0015924889 /DNA_START=171 /DNA_END=334 /DNA_ORIENTATION=-
MTHVREWREWHKNRAQDWQVGRGEARSSEARGMRSSGAAEKGMARSRPDLGQISA